MTEPLSELDDELEVQRTPLDTVAKPNASLLDVLRAQREELKQDHTVDLEIPGYKGLLFARYQSIGVKRAEVMGRALQREPKADRTLNGAIDTLLEACLGIYVMRDDELSPIDPDWPVATCFDQHLADLLAFESDSARDACLAVFPTEHAILKQAVKLSHWMQDVTIDVTEDQLGE